jgi:hypothetical protein
MKLRIPLKENHWALWNWLAKNPVVGGRLTYKEDWPGPKTIRTHQTTFPDDRHFYENNCFACQFVLEKYGGWPEDGEDSVLPCSMRKCPVNFGINPCIKLGSYFSNWTDASTIAKRSRWAMKIRDGWR